MAIRSPQEPVYYYECSAGDFHLVYFIPPNELRRLQANGITEQALKDFPDGVDLDCTEADFRDFHQLYGWRPASDPEALRETFLAIFSSTRHWKTFRGTGLIPAQDLDRQLGRVQQELERLPVASDADVARPRIAAGDRRRQRALDGRRKAALKKMRLPGIDVGQDLHGQRFSRSGTYSDGDSAVEVFSRLHEKRGR